MDSMSIRATVSMRQSLSTVTLLALAAGCGSSDSPEMGATFTDGLDDPGPAEASPGTEPTTTPGLMAPAQDPATNPPAEPTIIVDPEPTLPEPVETEPTLPEECEPTFVGIVRDFHSSHPDFQAYWGTGPSPGIVADQLGADSKPVYNLDGLNMLEIDGEQVYWNTMTKAQTSGRSNFDQWYRDVEGVNISFQYELPVTQTDDLFEFESRSFFPIDEQGFADPSDDVEDDTGLDVNEEARNFWFTFELHTEVVYSGGEQFTFSGDDDLWVFINGRLVLDLGGLHPRIQGTVELDDVAEEAGLVVGERYPLDLFHAERSADQSNFRFETSLEFKNCEPVLVDPPPPRMAR